MACGSHGGTPYHTRSLRKWLDSLCCTEADLVCGERAPLDVAAARALTRRGRRPTCLHNDCSAEHIGFVALAIAKKQPRANYADATHMVQEMVAKCIADFSGIDFADLVPLADGCGAPTYAMPLSHLALTAVRLVKAASSQNPARPAARHILKCCMSYPIAYGGPDRMDTHAMSALAHHDVALVKSGAEGVAIGGWMAKDGISGMGFALYASGVGRLLDCVRA